MNHVNVTINGRQYRMACVRTGRKASFCRSPTAWNRGSKAAARQVRREIGDARLTVMAALTVCDELLDASQRIHGLEAELTTLRDIRAAAADRARVTQIAVANALNAAADRIEKTTHVLNRTIGGGVAIG